MTLLVIAILSIAAGYYLMIAMPPDAPLEKVVREVKIATFLILAGSAAIVIYIFRRSK